MADGAREFRKHVRRRFVRAPERPAFQLTDRDIDIVRAVGQMRFLSSRHIRALLPGSDKNLLHRLTDLYHAGYLDRPRAQLDYYSGKGSLPLVYALADKGARLLIERDGLDLAPGEWAHKNREARKPFIAHTLAVADLHVALTAAVRISDRKLEMLHDRALVARFPKPPKNPQRPFAWHASHRDADGKTLPLSLHPDYVFALSSETIRPRCYLAECDRGTMPVERSDLEKTSMARKFLAYLNGHRDKVHEHTFGWKAFRILIVTPNAERIDNMRTALAKLTTDPMRRRLFYFKTAADLNAADPLTDWVDGNGVRQVLI